MPFLHWETNISRLQQYFIMKDINIQAQTKSAITDDDLYQLPCSVEEKLLRKYLWHEPPLHIRRTLDQFYHGAKFDTQDRDLDQVVLRHAKRNSSFGARVLMVDECWLWVIKGMPVLEIVPYLYVVNDSCHQTL